MAIFYNRATLSYNGNTTNSNITSGEIIEALSVTKSVLADSYAEGERITYAVSIINSSSSDIANVSLTDNLGAYTFSETQTLVPLDYVTGSVFVFSDGTLQPTPTVTPGDSLTVSGLTAPANGNLLVIYSAVPNEFAPLDIGSTITNTVTVDAPAISSPLTALASLAISDSPALSITKTLTPLSVEENGRITYTFVIENTSAVPAEVADNLIITDTFDPILSDIAVTYNGTAWAETTNYTYSETTGEFATNAGQITVPAATMVQNPTTGEISVTPGTSTVVVSGNI